MNVLIVKLGAAGDVVRTTPLLRRLSGSVTWITAAKNGVLLDGLADNLRHFSWEERARALDIAYDLAIMLEDTLEVALFLKNVRPAEVFGAYADSSERLRYTDNSKCWFDLSLISAHGKLRADKLKSQTRQTSKARVLGGRALRSAGERFLLPDPIEPGLSGDVAKAANAGPIWPMKK